MRPDAGAAPAHILFLDDDPFLSELGPLQLRRLGYRVTGFQDSGAALAAFHAAPQTFDLVLTDLVMPGLPGTALAAAIRARRPDVPIVLYGGNVTAPAVRAAALGVTEVVQKPLRLQELATVLHQVLEGRRC